MHKLIRVLLHSESPKCYATLTQRVAKLRRSSVDIRVKFTMNDEELFENLVPRHLEIWRNLSTNASKTNPSLAEQAINALYSRLKKSPPELIVWCDSPFQMGVLPPMMSSVVSSPQWKQLCQQLSATESSSPEFRRIWNAGWVRIKNTFSQLFGQIMERPAEIQAVNPQVRRTCEKKLETLLFDARSKGKILQCQWLGGHPPKDMPALFHQAKADRDFGRHLYNIENRVNTIAGIKLFEQDTLVKVFARVQA